MKTVKTISSLKEPALLLSALMWASSPVALASPDCHSLETKDTEHRVHQYMESHHLIGTGEESMFPELGVSTRWEVLKVTEAAQTCFAVMAVCTVTGRERQCSDEKEVVALGVDTRGALNRMVPFDQAYPVPKTLRARVGDVNHPERISYYVEFSKSSAVAAMKSWVTKTPYFGFSGVAVRGVKAPYDPTPGRTWHIEEAKFDLRRGSSAEVLDITADQLDGREPNEIWTGCQHRRQNPAQCLIAPWTQAFILEILP